MEMRDRADTAAPVVRDHALAERLGHGADLAQFRDAIAHEAVGLEDVVDALLQHPAELVQAAVVLAARDRQLDEAVELAEQFEGIAGEWLFQPGEAKPLELAGCRDGPPRSHRTPGCQAPGDCAWLASAMMSMRSPTSARTASAVRTSSSSVS